MSPRSDAPGPGPGGAQRWRDSRRGVLVGVLAVVVVGVLGGAVASPAWSLVPVPDDAVAITLTAHRDEVLVGTWSRGERPGPGLVRVNGGVATGLPVVPASGYGAEARWVSMAVDETGALVAVGAAHGGAHANPRWTVWRGMAGAGLAEQPQTFGTFGGWGAGELVGAVAPASGPLLVGSWESRGAGHDAAVWLPSGPATWARRSSVGTSLESTSDALVGVVSAAADGSRLLLSGSLVRLDGTAVRVVPVVWRSETGVTTWTRFALPGAQAGEARGAACAAGTCTVLGRADGQLAVWRLTVTAERLDTVPEVPLAEASVLAPPVLSTSGVLFAVPDPDDEGSSRLLRWTGGQWTSLSDPPGRVRALAVVGTLAYAVAPDADGTDRLWVAHL